MKTYNYNKELLVATAQMRMLFNNVMVKREDGTEILVKCLNGQRSRISKILQNPDSANFTLPLIIITRGNIIRDDARIANPHDNIMRSTMPYISSPNIIPPVNISIQYKVSIITKYPNDMDIILSNIIPFFNRDVYVSSPHPKLPGRTLNHQIIWSGTIDDNWPSQLDSSKDDIQICNTSFDFKTELFGGETQISDNQSMILYIDLTLSPATTAHPGSYSTSGDNVMSGFYPVPYSQEFSDYMDKIITNQILNPERDELHFTAPILTGTLPPSGWDPST